MADKDDIPSVRSRLDIIEGLLNDPKNHNRREELELLIEWRLAYEGHKCQPYVEQYKAFKIKQHQEEAAKHATVKGMFSLAASSSGNGTVLVLEKILPDAPEPQKNVDIMKAVQEQPVEQRILLPEPQVRQIASADPAAFGIRPKRPEEIEKELWEIRWSDETYNAMTALPKPVFKQ